MKVAYFIIIIINIKKLKKSLQNQFDEIMLAPNEDLLSAHLMKNKETIKLSHAEVDDIRTRLNDRTLTDLDIKIVGLILTTYQLVYDQLDKAKLTMRRLKGMLGFKTESKPKKPKDKDTSETFTPDDSIDSSDVTDGEINSKK